MKIDRNNWVCPKCHQHIDAVLPVRNCRGTYVAAVLVNGDDIVCVCPKCHDIVWSGVFSPDCIKGINEVLTSPNIYGTPVRMQA